jgi:hypothetical protein
MVWDFLHRYRATQFPIRPPLSIEQEAEPQETDNDKSEAGPQTYQGGTPNLSYELEEDEWEPQPVLVAPGWHPATWEERPEYFVDGKDVGETVLWLRAPQGYPVAVRLAEIGAVVVKVEGGICRRECEVVERVVSMVVDFFPWDEVEDLAAACLRHNLRLLPAKRPQQEEQYFDPEEMRKAAQNRSNDEMGILEEAMLAQIQQQGRAVVDGRLEPRHGGLRGQLVPVAGVIKTHSKRYLHDQGMRVLYALGPGERTPLFTLPSARFPVVSWYLRLTNHPNTAPHHGIIRVELPLKWFELIDWPERKHYVTQLSQLLIEYRCREASYQRSAISLHPIVRAEELLGALFTPWAMLARRFYRMTGL